MFLNIWLNRLSRRQSCTSKLVSNIYLEEIWNAICTIPNIKWGVTSASLNFQTEKSQKMPLVFVDSAIKPKMPDRLDKQTSCANTTVQNVFGTKMVY